MTSQPNLLELAKQGDAKAFSTLLDQKLEPKGISTKASTKNGCLHIMLEATKTPPQQPLVDFIQKAVTNLNRGTWQTVKIYGRRTGEDVPDWLEELKVSGSPVQNLEELAKQGDVKAIATLINRILQSQRIIAKVSLKGDCLQVMLEAAQAPDEQTMTESLKPAILRFGIQPITRVKLYGKQTDEDFPDWHQEFSTALQSQDAGIQVCESAENDSSEEVLSASVAPSRLNLDIAVVSNSLYSSLKKALYQPLADRLEAEDEETGIHEKAEVFKDGLEADLKLALGQVARQLVSLAESFGLDLSTSKIEAIVFDITTSRFSGIKLAIKQLEKVTKALLSLDFPEDEDALTASAKSAWNGLLSGGIVGALHSGFDGYSTHNQRQEQIQLVLAEYEKSREKLFLEWEVLWQITYKKICDLISDSYNLDLITYQLFSQAENFCGQSASYSESQKFKEALNAAERAIELNPRFAEAWNCKGYALCGLLHYEDAVKAYDVAIEFDVELVGALKNKGDALQKLECYTKAILIYDQALNLEPDNFWVWLSKVDALCAMGQYEEALKVCDTAITIDPENYFGWYVKATCSVFVDDVEQAVESLKEAAKINLEECRERAKNDIRFDSIRHDPRFKSLMEDSCVGIDYSKLKLFLEAKKWKEADQETARVMCLAAKTISLINADEDEKGFIDPDEALTELSTEEITNFPCVDLNTVNKLWVDCSDGKFGFSVQKEIYQSLGGTQEFDAEIRDKFGDSTGWRVLEADGNSSWRRSDRFEYNFDNAPKGHLPSSLWAGVKDGWFSNRRDRLIALFARMDACLTTGGTV